MATSTINKSECERAIRFLFHRWCKSHILSKTQKDELVFSNFISWIRQNYPRYLKFRTRTSVDYDAQLWFDQELNQTWRRHVRS